MSIPPTNSMSVLCWPKRLLSADDLRRHLTSQRELLILPRTIITPLALDELKARGIRIQYQSTPSPGVSNANPWDGVAGRWFYLQEKHDAIFASVILALDRDGISLSPFEVKSAWIVPFAEMLVAKTAGGVALVNEPATVACIANKIAGIRAATANSAAQVAKTQESLGANLFALDTAGKTFFEVRQLVKAIVTVEPSCSAEVAKLLRELEHAHR